MRGACPPGKNAAHAAKPVGKRTTMRSSATAVWPTSSKTSQTQRFKTINATTPRNSLQRCGDFASVLLGTSQASQHPLIPKDWWPLFFLHMDKIRYMAVHSNFLGSVRVSGDEAKALTRKVSHGRATRAAVSAAQNGRKLAMSFAKRGSVVIKIKPVSETLKTKG